MNSSDACQCSATDREGFGVKKSMFGDTCKKCNLPIVPDDIEFTPSSSPKYSLTDNTLEEQESLINLLISQMAEGGKYKKALIEGKFANFSITGTNDWEDYASSVFRILMLKELMRVSKTVEGLRQELEKLNERLDEG